MDSLDAPSLRAWTPVRVHTTGPEPVIDWAIVDAPYSEPFFEQTTDRAMQHPFNQVFGRHTPPAALARIAAADTSDAPAGFVFHMSRCGSTLIARTLAAMSHAVVLSEPQPLDALLRLRRRGAGLDEETLAEYLRGMLAALGRPRTSAQRLFVKFHAWHVLELPLLARAFPGVPWVFVFREPRAVLRSQARNPGAEVVAGTIDPGYAGLDTGAASRMPGAEYCARVLAALCEAALRHAPLGRAAFVEYAELPEAAYAGLPAFFGVPVTADDVQRMRATADLDAKSPDTAFRPRADEREDPALDQLAATWLDAPYAALRAAARRGRERPGGVRDAG